MKKSFRISIILLLIMVLTVLSGCGGVTVEQVMNVIAPEETPIPGADMEFQGEQVETKPVLSLTYEEMNGIFSPFFAETDGDTMAVKLTQLSLHALEGNRSPSTISRSANSDGSVAVTIQLQKGLKCADGETLTADDLLFTYYVLLDADYDGPYTLKTLPIRGLSAYWNGMDADMYGKYMTIYDRIYNNGRYEKDLEKALEDARQAALAEGVSEENLLNAKDVKKAQKELDDYDTERAEEIRLALEEAWKADVQAIVDYTITNYAGTISLRTDYTKEEVQSNTGLQVMYAMLDRGFGKINEDGSFTAVSGTTWDLKTEYPTTTDFYEELRAAYNEDVIQYWAIEGYARANMLEAVQNDLVRQWAEEDEDWRGSITSIEGLEKVDPYTVRFTMEYCDDAVLKTLSDIYVAPMHVYGDTTLFDEAHDSFGFIKGDLSSVRANNGIGMGAGEFYHEKTEIFTVTLSPNTHYWMGESENLCAELTKKI